MTNEELLLLFGEYVGIRHLRFDISRSCQLQIGSDFLVMINEISEERLLLNAVVGKITPQGAEQSALTILSMNMLFAHVEGPYVTFDPHQNILMLSRPLETIGLDAMAMEESIRYLLQNVEHIRGALEEKEVALKIDIS
ncbi:CesT family type III secretion system chaperone [Enterobacteriaceae bacterium H20N1]|uniref:Tir chaperone n=1 Tax=Dryocola boscaweniae TaxID=2925397 RepID=A0A9X2W3R4_9ENTR|nr:CesT family type III secretion system chaperone [Dryocola boscaweniae]MCT4700500.1 CesT family type III secretion system chaperone [Dryocola boscaweniae]MCT4717656.1 CesT family type III secretion system chaperone [Dryocola boscaweniae]